MGRNLGWREDEEGEGKTRNDGQKKQQHEAENPSPFLLHSTLKFCPHPSNLPWQVGHFCTAPSHSLPSPQPPPVPRFPPAVTSSFPLGMGTVGFSPTPSRGSCRNKKDLSGNGGFNMALALRSLGVDCQEPGPLTHYPSPPTHFLLS